MRRTLTEAELKALGPGPSVSEPQFRQLTGFRTRQGFWKARRRGDFPPAIRLGSHRLAWTVDAVRAWLELRPVA